MVSREFLAAVMAEAEVVEEKGKGKKGQAVAEVKLGPQVREGEQVFAVAHIFASFNDTFVHVTDISGKYVPLLLFFCMLYNRFTSCLSFLVCPILRASSSFSVKY